MENKLQSAERDGNLDENIASERKETSSRIKKNHPTEKIEGNLDDGCWCKP